MKREKLAVEKRKVLGKKVKKLRREGVLPANVYGKDIKSVSVQVSQKEFEKVFKEAGETGLVDLQLEGKSLPVLIHNVQTDYLGNKLHADFFQVNLKEKVKTMVPIIIVGEPKAVTDKVGLLMQIIPEVEVEALPEELPENIEVNVEPLATVDEQITVGDLKITKDITVLTDPTQVVVKISELVSKEAEALAAEEAAASEEAKTETGEETSTEGEKPTEEKEEPSAAKAPVGEEKPKEGKPAEEKQEKQK